MHSENGALKHFSVCVFCVWLSQSNGLIWHISVQENNNIPACSFLIVAEKKRLQAIHRLMAYFDTGGSGPSGAPPNESKGSDEPLLKWTDGEALAGAAAAGGHAPDDELVPFSLQLRLKSFQRAGSETRAESSCRFCWTRIWVSPGPVQNKHGPKEGNVSAAAHLSSDVAELLTKQA